MFILVSIFGGLYRPNKVDLIKKKVAEWGGIQVRDL